MDITVQAGGEPAPETDPQPVAAVAGSPLINLRAIRASKLAKLYLDLPVPRWDEGDSPIDQLVVRYRPLNSTAAINAVQKRQASKAEDWVALANADQLISACVGVYIRVADRCFTLAPGSVTTGGDASWVEWDPQTGDPAELIGFAGEHAPDLAAALGLDLADARSKAVALVNAIYFTDGDMGLACQELAIWSSKMGPQADQEALPE
jgi:hypothetical protein